MALTAALGLFMAVLDDTVVNVALSKMATDFQVNLSTIQWVSTAYLLIQAAIIPIAGYLGNRLGIKRLFLFFISVFTIGSLLCGLSGYITDASNHAYIGLLIAARVIQGIGAGALTPLASAIALGSFPPEERARASGIIAGPVLVAPVLGPLLGGWLIDKFDWPSIFFINVPIGLVVVLLGLQIFPATLNQRAEARTAFDAVGLALAMIGTVAVIYGLTFVAQTRPGSVSLTHPGGEVYGWGYWPVWALVGTGVVLLASFIWWELRQSDPVLEVRLFTNYNFTISNVISWFNAMVVFGSLLIMPIFFQQVRIPPLSATDAGLAQAPQGLGSIIGVIGGSILYQRLGPKVQIAFGLALLALSSYATASLTLTTNWYDITLWLFCRGLGFSLTFVPIQTLAIARLTGPTLPKATSLFSVGRQIFSSAGTATVITLYTQQTASHYTAVRGTAAQVHLAFAQAQTAAVNDVFRFVTLGTLCVLVLALVTVPRKQTAPSPSPSHEAISV